MSLNAKNFARNWRKDQPNAKRVFNMMRDGKDKPEDRFFRVYHPTKGWRTISLKRGVAQSIVSGRVYLRGHAIARMIAHGY